VEKIKTVFWWLQLHAVLKPVAQAAGCDFRNPIQLSGSLAIVHDAVMRVEGFVFVFFFFWGGGGGGA
jgi:hypothetical protein